MKKSRRPTLHFVISLVSHSNRKNIVTHICAGCRACIHLLHRQSQPSTTSLSPGNFNKYKTKNGVAWGSHVPWRTKVWLTDWLKCFIIVTKGQNYIQSTPKHLHCVHRACESSWSISECHHNNSTETIFLWATTVRQWCSSQLPWHWFKLQCRWSI